MPPIKIPINWVVGTHAWWVDPYNGDDPESEMPARYPPRLGSNRAEIVAVDEKTVTLKREADGEVWAFPKDGTEAKDYHKAPNGRGSDLPFAAEYDPHFDEGGYKNMTSLRKLNQAELDRNLALYHEQDKPYCYCGNTLVALNLRTQKDKKPIVDTSHLYTQECMEMYTDKNTESKDVDPHVFAIADSCFYWCFEPYKPDTRGGPQAMVITGESGAGKSYNTKKALAYLAYKGAPDTPPADGEVEVTKRMVDCNDILEAFGNASMPRNPDSSRFGKLFQIYFDPRKKSVKGCNINTYLLEKSRITAQGTKERNYHIFYMLLAGVQLLEQPVVSKQKKEYPPPFPDAQRELGLLKKWQYRSLNQTYDRLPSSRQDGNQTSETEEMYRSGNRTCDDDEIEAFGELLGTFCDAGFSAENIQEIMRVVAFCLEVNNIDMIDDPSDSEYAIIDPASRTSLEHCAQVLRVEPAKLEAGLMQFTRSAKFAPARYNKEKAEQARASLARNLYNDMFENHIVTKIKENLIGPPGFVDESHEHGDPKICILDIFGFEFTPDKKLVSSQKGEGMPLMRNSLEQFCINWCNEALQALFIECTIKAENIFYVEQLGQKIDIDITALDNKETLEMIQGKSDTICSRMKDAGTNKTSFAADRNSTREMKLLQHLKKVEKSDKNHDGIGRAIVTFPTKLNTSEGATSILKFLKTREKKDQVDMDHIFALKHYAGTVTYSLYDWIQKDANKVTTDMIQCLFEAQSGPWTTSFYSAMLKEGADKGASLISQAFKSNMAELTSTLAKCNCWFTRCIKPCNKQKCELYEPYDCLKLYEGHKVLDQLRYTGMLDSLTIRKIGYPERQMHEDFAFKYRVLNSQFTKEQHKELADWIMKQKWYDEGKSPYAKIGQGEDIRIGKTMVLIRDTSYQLLEAKRDEFLYAHRAVAVATIKAWIHGNAFKEKYLAIRGGGKYRDDAKSGEGPYDVVHMPVWPEGLNCVIRGTLDRLKYYKQKWRWLEMMARTPLVLLIRAQIARNAYLKARNAKFESLNRQLIAGWMTATVVRQKYYEQKMQWAEGQLISGERERMAIYEQSSQEYMMELEVERRRQLEEENLMQKEENYARQLADAFFLESLGKQKESLWMNASDALRRAQDTILHFRTLEGEGTGLEEQIKANEQEIELGSHLKVQELLQSFLPENLKVHGTCHLVRGPETGDYQLTAPPLEPFPENCNDLGTIRRYIYSTNKVYREKHPDVPRRRRPDELDEQFTGTFDRHQDQADPEAEANYDDVEQDAAGAGGAADAIFQAISSTDAKPDAEPVPTHFETGVELQLSVDPSSLNDEEKRRLIVEMAKIVGCDPSALNVK